MGRSDKEDPKLSEVKAVLQRLQTISAEPDSAALQPATHAPRPARPIAIAAVLTMTVVAVILAATYVFFDFKQLAISKPRLLPASTSAPQKAATEIVSAVVPGSRTPPPLQRAEPEDRPAVARGSPPAPAPQIVAPDTTPTVDPGSRSMPPTEPSPTPPVKPALEVALGLMSSGRVQAARRQLLGLAAGGSADVAWALARSYDPNFLSTIPAADATPDIEEATRWYRTWYAVAVRDGLVADSVSLERIIRSMR